MEHVTIATPVAGRYEMKAKAGYLLKCMRTGKMMKEAVTSNPRNWTAIADTKNGERGNKKSGSR